MSKHFKLTENTIVKWGRTLYQIEATISFKNVKKGQLGGWVESAACLASDDVWLYPDVMAKADARFHNGVFSGGEFSGGEFWGGVFHNGVFSGGEFWGGVFHNGVFIGGEFSGGEFWGGEFSGGEFWGGVFHNGVFSGGEFHNGVFSGGVFIGGEFEKTLDYMAFYSFGSAGRVTTAYLVNGKIEVVCGCFRGGIKEFAAKVKATHGTNEHAKEYALVIKLIKQRFKEQVK